LEGSNGSQWNVLSLPDGKHKNIHIPERITEISSTTKDLKAVGIVKPHLTFPFAYEVGS
jgi:hypothetical protein